MIHPPSPLVIIILVSGEHDRVRNKYIWVTSFMIELVVAKMGHLLPRISRNRDDMTSLHFDIVIFVVGDDIVRLFIRSKEGLVVY
jgi:hypothetical protein